jgi:hypothetical protein
MKIVRTLPLIAQIGLVFTDKGGKNKKYPNSALAEHSAVKRDLNLQKIQLSPTLSVQISANQCNQSNQW